MSFTPTINQEFSSSNMSNSVIDFMQSSGQAKTAPPAWYCPSCNYGPLNPCTDVGCPMCGFVPAQNRKAEQLQCSGQYAPTCSLTPTFPTSPAETSISLQNNAECWMSPELGAPKQCSESFLHNSYDGSETRSNFPYFN